MKLNPIDPRDQTLEVDDPSYRVFFWKQSDPSCEVGMWHSDEWELSETDILEVLAWTMDNAKGRAYSVWAVIGNDTGVTHVRLAGKDPTAPAGTFPPWT